MDLKLADLLDEVRQGSVLRSWGVEVKFDWGPR